MAIDIFEPLKDLQGNKMKSASWYRNAVSLIADRSSPSELFASGKLLGRPSAGRMSMFFYDPKFCLLYTSPSPRDLSTSRMPSSA